MVDKDSSNDLPKRLPSQSGFNPPAWFWDSRKKGPSPVGSLVFTVARALDVPFQYWLLRSGAASSVLRSIGVRVVAPPLTSSAGRLLGLSPYHALIVGLAAGSSVKQIYWKLAVGQEVMHPGFAAMVGVLNTTYNSLNTALALWIATSQQPADQTSLRSFLATAPPSLYVAVIYYVMGLSIEWLSEVQRKSFKDDPSNKGKPYSGGLFGLARNINYGGYAIWRSSYSLLCGGWIYAGTMFTLLASDFCGRAIPCMDAYCEQRYGNDWDEVKRRVPFRFLPWIY